MKEQLPTDALTPLEKPVVLLSFVDANLLHEMTTGRLVAAVLHLVNQSPVEWFSKKQATVETATYQSEFAATKLTMQQSMNIQNMMGYLGVAVKGANHLFRDNGLVVTSASQPYSPLHKQHNALSHH